MNEIEKYQRVLSPGDMFLFYFSGHGCEQDGKRQIAVPQYDVQGNYLDVAGLTIDMLKAMTDIRGLHRLFVLDCCRSQLQQVNNLGARSKMAGYMHRHNSRAIIQPTILSSSAPGQCSYEDTSSGHGYFTEAFLAAIRNSEVRTFNMFRDRLDYEMQNLRTPGAQDPYFEGGIGSNLPFWPTWTLTEAENGHYTQGHHSTNVVICLEDIEDAFKDYCGVSFFVGEKIPVGKRRNAWNSMRVKGYDTTILALYDATFWGGAREGVAITHEGLYAKSYNAEPTFFGWRDINKVEINSGHLRINEREVSLWYVANHDEAQKICDAIVRLIVKAVGVCSAESAQQQDASSPMFGNCSHGHNNPHETPMPAAQSRFCMTVEDIFNIELGYVLSGIVKGSSVNVGDDVEILRWDRLFFRATIAGIERQAKAVRTATVGDLVGLLIEPDRRVLFSSLEPGMVVRACAKEENRCSNSAKRKIPCRKKKSDYPHVLMKDKNGALAPEPGYAWANSSHSNDYDVVWKPGSLHPDIFHVVASDVEGYWIPEQGYEWRGPKSVKKKMI